MVFYDVSKPYRDKVNVFNATSFYGAEQARIQQDQQNRTETRSAGGLDDTAQETSYWKIDNPVRSVIGDQAFLNNYGMFNPKFKQTEVNKLQYIQQPVMENIPNKWIDHLLEIEANRVPNVKPSFAGNGEMVLEVDKNA
jgi:hypothetical protein